ncbi:DUF1499 domain-containing protein [Frigidibacter sp. RF13]|uniref:DUF1499 domain-containing protein n=1 Tax=Frigidibacter sp. RF13 TaxID=2997340 RepID=UPI002D1E4A08|nr:DUF1499 domain-containing protein [Frigidibacter sp. RF13]
MFYALLLILVGGMAWIRLAPDDPARWHVDPGPAISHGALTAVPPGPDSVIVVPGGARAMIGPLEATGEAALGRLDTIAMATPRTRRLAGSPKEGRITWVTRSATFGFPDYTTAEVRVVDGMIFIDLYARLRYGRRDFGVNAARLRDWLSRLGAD